MFVVNITVCGKKINLFSNLSLSASRSCLEDVLTANQLKKFYAIIGLRQTICLREVNYLSGFPSDA